MRNSTLKAVFIILSGLGLYLTVRVPSAWPWVFPGILLGNSLSFYFSLKTKNADHATGLAILFPSAFACAGALGWEEPVVFFVTLAGVSLLMMGWFAFFVHERNLKLVKMIAALNLLLSLYVFPFNMWLTQG